MKERRFSICLLNSTHYDPILPTRPEIIEIYGKYLPSYGHKIIWISRGDSDKIEKTKYNEVEVYIVPYKFHKSLFMKAINLVIHSFKKYKLIKNIQRHSNIDIIQSRLDIFNALIGLRASKRFKIPSVYQFHFPQPLFTYTNKNKKLERIALFIQKYILKKTDLILPINTYMLNYLKNRNVEESKLYTLPMGVNHDTFSPNQKNEKLRSRYNLHGNKIFIYVGTMDKSRNLEVIIKAFALVKKNIEKTKLLMVGEGNGKEELEELSRKLNIENDTLFVGKVPYSEVLEYINLADIGLCPVPPLPMFIMSSPTKILEYLSTGIPVIGNREIIEVRDVITSSNGGLLVDFDFQSFAECMLQLVENDKMRRMMGKKGREWVISHRSYDQIAKGVEKQYFKLVKRYNSNKPL